MIKTIFKINWLHLRRDYVALGMSFILPVAFFSIFASIFSNSSGTKENGQPKAPQIKLIALDLDQSEISQKTMILLGQQEGFNLQMLDKLKLEEGIAYDRDQIWKQVRKGKFDIGLVVQEGYGENFGQFGKKADLIDMELFFDPSNPFAQFAVSGTLQGVAMKAAPDIVMEKGLNSLSQFGGGLTKQQQEAIDYIRPYMKGEKTMPGKKEGSSLLGNGLVQIKSTNVRDDKKEETKKQPSIVPYYAAGISVMFLLFSMVGASGSLLEEKESGALDRVLFSGISISKLLVGKWLFFSLIGFAQVMLMFVWAALVFDLELWTWSHFMGCLVMSVFTACAASALGIGLATICKTRAQLGGISSIVIIMMSALGGSMVPRFMMPEFMKKVGKFTFNGQALDGYLNIFWYDEPQATVIETLAGIGPQLLILTGMMLVFLWGASIVGKKWEVTV